MSVADDVIMGFVCESCLGWIDGDAPGHPRKCEDCKDE